MFLPKQEDGLINYLVELYLINIITVKAISCVAIWTWGTLNIVCCLSAHIVAETDTRSTSFHLLRSTQTLKSQSKHNVKSHCICCC